MTTFGPDYIRAIAPYQGGKPISEVAREFGLDEASIVKLASNENPLGLPASAKAAMQQALDDLARYPDSNGFDLKAALTKKFGVASDWLTLGNGSNDILELAARALVQPGQSVVYSEYSFAVYPLATQAVGARAIVVPSKHFGHDLDAMAAAVAAGYEAGVHRQSEQPDRHLRRRRADRRIHEEGAAAGRRRARRGLYRIPAGGQAL